MYCQASFSKEAWTPTVKIMDLFEQGKIKDQKLSIHQLTSKPDFKQQYLQPVQYLPDSFKLQILTSVAEKDMSFSELKKAGSDYRAEQAVQKAVQKAFCKCTNTTWEGAWRRYPLFITKDRLQQFFWSQLIATSICRILPSSNTSRKLHRTICNGRCIHLPGCAFIYSAERHPLTKLQ